MSSTQSNVSGERKTDLHWNTLNTKVNTNEKRLIKVGSEENGVLKHFIAGAVAGVVSRTVTARLDQLKVYLQVHGLGQSGSLISVAGTMYREGGVKSFWRGNTINVLKVAPNSALTFMIYDVFKKKLQDTKHNKKCELTTAQRFVAGGLAGVLSSTIIYPLDTFKTRLVLRKTGQYRGIVDAVTKIYRNEGARVFYRGLLPNIVGIIPYSGIELALYETLKKRWASAPADESNTVVLLGCGIVASTFAQLMTYPLALIRTRMQAPAGLVHGAPVSMTMTGLFRSIVVTQGLRALYSGIFPNLMKGVPSTAINYVVYEKCRQYLGVKMT